MKYTVFVYRPDGYYDGSNISISFGEIFQTDEFNSLVEKISQFEFENEILKNKSTQDLQFTILCYGEIIFSNIGDYVNDCHLFDLSNLWRNVNDIVKNKLDLKKKEDALAEEMDEKIKEKKKSDEYQKYLELREKFKDCE